MLAMVSLLALSSPLALEISIPETIKTGQEVQVTVRARNVSRAPITLVRVTPPNTRLGLGWTTELLQNGRPVLREQHSEWFAQWFYGRKVSEKAFVVVKPGESVQVYSDHFKSLLPDGESYTTNAEYASAPRADLSATEYTFKARLSFARSYKDDGGALTPKLSPAARALYAKAWVGSIEASKSFRVEDR